MCELVPVRMYVRENEIEVRVCVCERKRERERERERDIMGIGCKKEGGGGCRLLVATEQ